MRTRIIYLIRDSLTNRYYTTADVQLGYSEKEYDDMHASKTFDNAVIHTTVDSVRNGVKGRIRMWKRYLESALKAQTGKVDDYWDYILKMCEQRKDLPAWGMEIVAIEIEEKGWAVPLK